jgi:hypothetical protein
MGNTSNNDVLIITSTGWNKMFSYIPVKLINGKWIWFKPFYARVCTGVNHSGFIQITEFADLFYVIANPDKSIFPL